MVSPVSRNRRLDIVARIAVTVAALLPYWRILTFKVIYITDDIFASDIFNGELPGRVLIADIVRRGELPAWTSQLCSGLPLAGAPVDPLGLASFVFLPTAPALDLYVVVLLLIAAHGAYSLARRLETDRLSGVLASVAFAASGYITCQLKHLSIVSTVVWLPIALVLLDRAFDLRPRSSAKRSRDLALFGLVFMQQTLSGFPQSAYICALVYASFGLFKAVQHRREFGLQGVWLLGGAAAAGVLGSAAGALVLLPLAQLGSLSDRGVLGYEWATRFNYSLRNIWMFLFPYANGDIGNNTYIGPSIFWEDYAYVGFFTFLLAIYGGFRNGNRPAAKFILFMTLVAFVFALGGNTHLYHLAYYVVPGLKMFRLPTRFLVVVDLGLSLLAAIGLTRLRADLSSPRSRDVPILCVALVGLIVLDLCVHQPRQNPIVNADTWLAPPASVPVIRAGAAAPRTFTPGHRDFHQDVFIRARGWANVSPYFTVRDLLEPNIGGALWDIPSADCYAGVTARWHPDVWSDHNQDSSLVTSVSRLDVEAAVLRAEPVFPNVLKTFGVTHVLSPFPIEGASFPPPTRAGTALVYPVSGAARVRFVSGARIVTAEDDAIQRLRDPAFDPDREILLEGPIASSTSIVPVNNVSQGRARIVSETDRDLTVSVDASADGYLLVADTYDPGWTATIDGSPTPVYRANVSVRGIAVPKGSHTIGFHYDLPGARTGLLITSVSVSVLLVWVSASCYVDLVRRRRRNPIDPQNPTRTNMTA